MPRNKKEEPRLEPLKIFISTPIRDQEPEQIKLGFEKIDKAIKMVFESSDNNRFEVSTVHADPEWLKDDPVVGLGKAIQRMGECDVVFFTDNWAAAKGCIIEREIATLYEFPVLELTYSEGAAKDSEEEVEEKEKNSEKISENSEEKPKRGRKKKA